MEKRINHREKIERAEFAYELRVYKKYTLSSIGRILKITPCRVDQIVHWYELYLEDLKDENTIDDLLKSKKLI